MSTNSKIKRLKERKAELDRKLLEAEKELKLKNRKMRNHRLIRFGAAIDKKLKEQYDFDMMELSKKDFDEGFVAWEKRIPNFPKWEISKESPAESSFGSGYDENIEEIE